MHLMILRLFKSNIIIVDINLDVDKHNSFNGKLNSFNVDLSPFKIQLKQLVNIVKKIF